MIKSNPLFAALLSAIEKQDEKLDLTVAQNRHIANAVDQIVEMINFPEDDPGPTLETSSPD
jgi:hypothetical protein